MEVNIVTNSNVINIVRRSKYFKMSLGFVSTIEAGGGRKGNNKDAFAYFYNNLYQTTIYGKGIIGNISFYADQYIVDDVLAVYLGDNFEEFIFDLDSSILNSKGVDFYLGHILKQSETEYERRENEKTLRILEKAKKGDASRLLTNPGEVSYEDIKAYMEEQRKNRQL